jgi:hypothetical protein
MKGSQLVSNILKDAGVPAEERDAIPVLADNKEILWIPGIKVGRTAVADNLSVRIWRVSLAV